MKKIIAAAAILVAASAFAGEDTKPAPENGTEQKAPESSKDGKGDPQKDAKKDDGAKAGQTK